MDNVPNVLLPAPDDPRLLLGEPFRAVHFIYGLFHPDVRPLGGRALVGSLAALGFGDEASRGIVLRLRRAGFLGSRRVGREAVYELSPRSLGLIGEIARRSADAPPPWNGAFDALLVQIPTGERAYREQLRRQAAYAGFGSPMPGLLIAPYDSSLALLEPVLARCPAAAQVTIGRLTMDPGDAASLARRAWNLEVLATALSHESKRMHAAAADAAAGPLRSRHEAISLLWRSIGPYFALLSANPPLPSVLLPADWPMDAARAAFIRLAMVVAQPAREFVEDLERGWAERRRSPERRARAVTSAP